MHVNAHRHMASRKPFLDMLRAYEKGARSEDQEIIIELRDHVLCHRNCFDRMPKEGAKHIGASVFLLTRDLKQALFLWNIKLGCWAQPGGHADGNPNIYDVALQELRQETGIVGASLVSPIPFEIYRYDFPREVFGYRKSIYTCFFYSILPVDQEPKVMEPDKCGGMCWVTPERALELYGGADRAGYERLIRKWKVCIAEMVPINIGMDAER
jgi:8-oxo-dGTP pyrophosphatase MutT (NUDIX family)